MDNRHQQEDHACQKQEIYRLELTPPTQLDTPFLMTPETTRLICKGVFILPLTSGAH